MFCRGVYKEDGLEYEGVIMSVESTDDGQYAVVEFVGYGNQETLWLQELLKVRKFQKEILVSSILLNINETISLVFALASNKWLASKNKDTFLIPPLFRCYLGKIFCFGGKLKTPKFPSEISIPLVLDQCELRTMT